MPSLEARHRERVGNRHKLPIPNRAKPAPKLLIWPSWRCLVAASARFRQRPGTRTYGPPMDALGAGYRYAGRPLGTPCSLSANVENVMWQRVIALKTRLGELTVIVSSDDAGV
ncbi:hypothetical protein V8C35DRAFT_299752 [Trichoderma chlorosporum]